MIPYRLIIININIQQAAGCCACWFCCVGVTKQGHWTLDTGTLATYMYIAMKSRKEAGRQGGHIWAVGLVCGVRCALDIIAAATPLHAD